VSGFCFVVAALVLATQFSRKFDILSPGKLFTFVWAVAIGLADLKLSAFQHEWTWYAWICLLVPVFSFLLGVMVVNLTTIGRPVLSLSALRARLAKERINEAALFNLTFLLFLAYSLAFVIEWANYGTLPLFAPRPDLARTQLPVFAIHLFVNAMPTILFMCVLYFLFVSGERLKKMILGCIFVLIFFSFFLLLNRLMYAVFLILAVGTAYYGSRILRPTWVVPSIVVFVGIMRYLQSFREVAYAGNFFYVVSRMRYSVDYAEFTGPYMYVVMNLENYARAVEKVESFTFGYFTFDFITALVGLKSLLGSYFQLKREQFLMTGYNTFPSFWDYYQDFGLLGTFVISTLLGAGIALLYKRLRESPSILLAAMYSMALFAIVFSFFANMLGLLNIMFNVGLTFLTLTLISKRNLAAA
jgi:oligosaccharide repeat unit polymerase